MDDRYMRQKSKCMDIIAQSAEDNDIRTFVLVPMRYNSASESVEILLRKRTRVFHKESFEIWEVFNEKTGNGNLYESVEKITFEQLGCSSFGIDALNYSFVGMNYMDSKFALGVHLLDIDPSKWHMMQNRRASMFNKRLTYDYFIASDIQWRSWFDIKDKMAAKTDIELLRGMEFYMDLVNSLVLSFLAYRKEFGVYSTHNCDCRMGSHTIPMLHD